jgi:hypothetical protein
MIKAEDIKIIAAATRVEPRAMRRKGKVENVIQRLQRRYKRARDTGELDCVLRALLLTPTKPNSIASISRTKANRGLFAPNPHGALPCMYNFHPGVTFSTDGRSQYILFGSLPKGFARRPTFPP